MGCKRTRLGEIFEGYSEVSDTANKFLDVRTFWRCWHVWGARKMLGGISES